MSEFDPLQTNANGGRGIGGKFAGGHSFSRGPRRTRAARMRKAYAQAVKPEDMADVARAVLAMAKDGDIGAARELCDRLLGRPTPTDLNERLEALEASLTQRNHHNGAR